MVFGIIQRFIGGCGLICTKMFFIVTGKKMEPGYHWKFGNIIGSLLNSFSFVSSVF